MADPAKNERNIRRIRNTVQELTTSLEALAESLLSHQVEVSTRLNEQDQRMQNLIDDAIADRKAMQTLKDQVDNG